MTKTERPITRTSELKISFEFFPPKSPDMEAQLWQTVEALQPYQPDFVSVTYGAGGTTREPTLSTVKRLIDDTPLATASHLTCVGATRDEVRAVVEEFEAAGVRHFVALRGDPQGGVGTRYAPHPAAMSTPPIWCRACGRWAISRSLSRLTRSVIRRARTIPSISTC